MNLSYTSDAVPTLQALAILVDDQAGTEAVQRTAAVFDRIRAVLTDAEDAARDDLAVVAGLLQDLRIRWTQHNKLRYEALDAEGAGDEVAKLHRELMHACHVVANAHLVPREAFLRA